jgi:thiamine-phosphate pyrophosphorylase
MNRVDWSLCFIADSEAAAGRDILPLIGEAVAGGATLIQLRGKIWTSAQFLNLGIKAHQFLLAKKIPLIINDRVDIAQACEADGVHLGQDDMPFHYARKILGNNRLIGISVKTEEEAVAAERDGADYIGVGPIFKTFSKDDSGPEIGLAGLREVRAKVKIPILAIGGISAGNAADVISAGADGVAVISAIAAAMNPHKAAAKFIEAVGNIKNRTR